MAELQATTQALEAIGLNNQDQDADGMTALGQLIEVSGMQDFDTLARVPEPDRWATDLTRTVVRTDSEFTFEHALNGKIALLVYYAKDRFYKGMDWFDDDGQGNGTLLGFAPADHDALANQMDVNRNLKSRSNSDLLPAFRPSDWFIWKDEVLTALSSKQGATGFSLQWIIREVKDAGWNPITDAEDSKGTPLLQGAIRQQRNIGFNTMLRGFLAEGWYTALQDSGCDHPDTRICSRGI